MRETHSQSTELPHLVDIDSIAEHLGVEVRHVRRLVFERRIPYIKWGHLLRFDPVDIAAWLDECTCQPREASDLHLL
jgi:excisionase family DNA binding protein